MSVMGEAWKACLVRRWHTNATLNDTNDSVGGHSARMVLLAHMLEPTVSRNLIMSILTHDLGEYKIGDIPWPFKAREPNLWAEIEKLEEKVCEEMGYLYHLNLSEKEAKLLRLVDRLDSYLWAVVNKPYLEGASCWEDTKFDVTIGLLNDEDLKKYSTKVEEIIDKVIHV